MKMNRLCMLAVMLPLTMLNIKAAENTATPNVAKTFLAEMATKADTAEKANISVIRGKDNWLFISSELKSLGVGGEFWGENATKASHVTNPDAQDPLAAIVDFQKQCDKAGVELILVPVPGKSVIYPEMISDTVKSVDGVVPRLDIYHEKFYKVLKDNGVKVVDLTPVFLQHRNDATGGMFCHTDTHWSPQACVLVAKMLGEDIKNRTWYEAVAKRKYEAVTRDAEVIGDLAGMLADPAIGKEKLKMTVVQEKIADGLTPVDSWRESPIVLLGDSHNLIFHGGDDMLYSGAGLADSLAIQLGFPVDLVAVRGSGATPARKNLSRRKDNLVGKKLVIWCFTTREFTEGQGWSKVAVVK